MAQSLIIKDGVGAIKSLTVESSSYGFMPVHFVTSSTSAPVYITASSANPLPVTGSISVDVVVGDIITVTSSLLSPVVAYAYSPPVTTVAASSITSFTWATAASGTFSLASNSLTRRGLTVFNPGPYNLYIAFSTAGGTTNGFTLLNTASAPTQYSFIVFPSGTYTADPTTIGVYHGGYFISGSSSVGVFISAIS